MAYQTAPIAGRVRSAQDALCAHRMRIRCLQAAGQPVPASLANEGLALQRSLVRLLGEQDQARREYGRRHGAHAPTAEERQARGLDVFAILASGLA